VTTASDFRGKCHGYLWHMSWMSVAYATHHRVGCRFSYFLLFLSSFTIFLRNFASTLEIMFNVVEEFGCLQPHKKMLKLQNLLLAGEMLSATACDFTVTCVIPRKRSNVK
jgi:hypothetical protein